MSTIRRHDTKRCFSLKAIEWKQRQGRAKDIAVGADDAIWVVGTNGIPFRWNGKGWSQIGSKAATRISVQPDGRPWITTASGELFRWHCVYWQKMGLPTGEKAQDVGAGADGTVAITTTSQKILVFQKDGTWKQQPGSAVRIDVGPKGQLWAVNKEGNVYEKTDRVSAWKKHSAKPANDIAAGPEGSVYVTGEDSKVMKLGVNGKFWNMGGSAREVAVGKGGRPFVVNKHHHIFWPANTCVTEKSFEYYVDNKGSKTWFDAEETCKRWGGHLASIRQGREKARIMNLMALEGVPANKDAWVGGRIQSGKRSWTDGYAKGDIRYFPITHSKDGCTALNGPKTASGARMMDPESCGTEKPFVCKRVIGGKAPGMIPGKQCPDFGRALPSRDTREMNIVKQAKTANWLSKLDKISFCNSKKSGKTFLSKLRIMFNNFDNRVYKSAIPGAKFFGCKTVKINKKASGKVTYVKHFWNTLRGIKIATGFKIRFHGGQTVVIGHRGCENCHVYENFFKNPKTIIGFAAKTNGEAATSMRLIYNSCPARVFSHDAHGNRRGTQCKKEDNVAWKKRAHGVSDIAVSAVDRAVYTAGLDGKVTRNGKNVAGAKDASRIAVTPAGEVFTVSEKGVVRSLGAKDTKWKSYAMRALDVGAGANGQVWIVNGRGKVAFLKKGKFYIYGNTPCTANRITVEYNGQPAIVCKDRKIYKSAGHSGRGQHWRKLAGRAMDIAAGPSGDMMIIGQNSAGNNNMGIWRYIQKQRAHARGDYWFRINGKGGNGIAVGKHGHPYAVDSNGQASWPDKACESGKKRIWYHTSKFALNWHDAKAYCERNGWHLAPVFTENENYQFQSDKDVQKRNEVWVGGRNYPVQGKKYKVWRWSHNHRHFSFRNWAVNKPSRRGDCLALKKNGRWQNLDCKQERTFVCRDNKVIDTLKVIGERPNMCKNYSKIVQRMRSGVKAVDVAANANGVIMVVSKDGKVMRHGWRKFHGFSMNHWTQFGHNVQARRAAVTKMGNPWIVDRQGRVQSFDSKRWNVQATHEKMTDIAISGDHIFTTGVSGKVYKHGHHAMLGPKASRITVDTYGNPVICGQDGKIHRAHGNRWMTMEGVHGCTDVSVGPEGSFVATTKYGSTLKSKMMGKHHRSWIEVTKGNENVAVGKGGRIISTRKGGSVWWPRSACKFVKPGVDETHPWTYWIPKKTNDWHAARTHCRKAGGELASAENDIEHYIMSKRMRAIPGTDAWVGNNDLQHADVWQWSNKKATKMGILENNWNLNMPKSNNADCGTFNLKTKLGKFGQSKCYNKRKFMCRRHKKNPTPYTPACPKSSFQYKFFAAAKTWSAARSTCASEYGGELASIQNYCEQHEVSKHAGNSRETWMGANALNLKGAWNWSDASKGNGLRWKFWASGNPQKVKQNQQEMCGSLVKSLAGHRWQDRPCNQRKSFVCKRSILNKHKNAKFEFLLRRDKQSWKSARNVCRSWGGDLATINSWSEQRTAYRLVAENQVGRGSHRVGRAWIGGKASKNDWKWANGRSMGWNWFTSGAKSEGCAEIYTPNARGKWNNRNCDTASAYICKRAVGAKARSSAWQSPKTFTNGEKQYALHYFKRTWADARQFCLKWGGDLATVKSAVENHTINKTIRSHAGAAWIGANDLEKEGKFTWASGKSNRFTNWAKGQPSHGSGAHTTDCVSMNRKSGQWDDVRCNSKHEFVCERTASEATFKYVSNQKLNWPDAQKSCRQWGGHLASIRTAAEQDQIKSIVHTKSPVWIGANDLLQEGKWMWTDGTLLAFKNWHKNEPNNFGGREDCGALWNGMKWNDWFCSSKAYYICEKRVSTLAKERKQVQLEREQRRKTASHFIAKRHAALRREILLKGKMSAEAKIVFERRWTIRAHMQASVLLKQKIREQREARRQALLKIAAEKAAKHAHAHRVRMDIRAAHSKRDELISIKNAQIAAALAAKAAARAVHERNRKVWQLRRAHIARLARIRATKRAQHARKMQGLAEMRAFKAIHQQRLENKKARVYIRATAAAVVRAQNSVRARKIAERMYAAKIKIERSMQRKAENHERRAINGTIRSKRAFLKAKVSTRNAMNLAALYKRQYHLAIRHKRHAEKLTLHFNNRAAKMRHHTRVAYKVVRLANRKAAIAISKAKSLKHRYTLVMRLAARAHKDTVHYRLLAKKALHARNIAMHKYRKANHARLHWIRMTKRTHVTINHVIKMIHRVKSKHAKMIRHAKIVLHKLIVAHKKMIKNITKHGKAAIHRIVLKIRVARENHDKVVNWYIKAIAKLNKQHDHHKAVYRVHVRKTKMAVHLTKHLLRLVKIARHAAYAAHKLALKYNSIRITHVRNTRISLALYHKWSRMSKHAIRTRKHANAMSVRAISARVKAEADYARHHAAMLIAQKKTHVLRLRTVRYRQMVAHHIRMTKKHNASTRFHRGKQAHWNRLAFIARAAARKYLRHAAQEHKMRLHWIVIYKQRVAAERRALIRARRNNAAAAAMEARAKIFAEAAKRATRLAIRQQNIRISAEKRTKIYIHRQITAHIRYKKEQKHRYHLLRLARQADRKAAREWARRNRYVKEMRYAIKKMMISIAHRKRVVRHSMTVVSRQNHLMMKANIAADKSRRGRYAANIKAKDFRKQRDHFNGETRRFIIAAQKAHHESIVAKAKHAKYDKIRISATRVAAKYLKHAKIEISRRNFLDKVARAARIATATFRGKVVVQKKFTATAWKQYHAANRLSKRAIVHRNLAIKAWRHHTARYKHFHAKYLSHKRRTHAIRVAIKHVIFKHKMEQAHYNRVHAQWTKATTRKHKSALWIRLTLHKKRMSHWARLIRHERNKLRTHLRILAHQTRLFVKARHAAVRMHSLKVKAQADAHAAHKALKIAVHLRNVEIKKARIAYHFARVAEKRMREAIHRAKVALKRRLHAEHVSRQAQIKMKHAMKWAHKMLVIRKLAFKLYIHHKKRAAHATMMAKKMTHHAKMWVMRARSMYLHSERARKYADRMRHIMEKAQQVAREASAAWKRAVYRLRQNIKRRHAAEHLLRLSVRARVHAHAVLRAAARAHKRAYSIYVRVKKTLFLAQAAVRRAIASRRIAESEAKKRLAFQQIRLHKWISTHITLRKLAMAASVRARISAQVAHTQHIRAYHFRIRETRTQVARTIRQAITLAKLTAHAKRMARRAVRDARLRLRQRSIARMYRNRAIAAKVRAAAKAAREAIAQRAALLKAQAIRKAVHDYIMKVRLQHAVRNYKFDLTQCRAAKKNLHALWGQHSLKSRKNAMRAARRNWCRASSTRIAQIRSLHLVIKGKLSMSKVHSLRKSAFNLERRARGQHNYVWSPRKSTCKDKCMKYKDWLKVVTALAKAMAMKPCGKVPGAPSAGVKYITHNKSVKIVHGNKMVLTHHITYHVCKAQNNCSKVRRTVTSSQKVAPRPSK